MLPLLNIKEPDISDIAIGIDFGTTNSLIAYSVNQRAKIISGITPSIISYNNNIVIGKELPESINIKSIKRLFGKNIKQIQESQGIPPQIKKLVIEDNCIIKLNIHNKFYTLVEIASQIFQELKNKAVKHLNVEINEAVITIPAYFDELARVTVKQAAYLAGIKVLRLINEPSAAAYFYGLNKNKEGVYIIYDLGGGTFDVSLLKIHNGVFHVIATGGDDALGGDDIDIIVDKYLLNKFNISNLNLAKNIKESLSKKREIIKTNFNINLMKFNSLIKHLIDRTITITKDVIHCSEVKDIDGIVLVGGSTKIKLVKESLIQAFDIPVLNDVHPEHIVALGAALHAENLIKDNKNLIIDVTSLSLGIELVGGLVEKIIFRNTSIPCQVTKYFTTSADNQTGIQIHIMQGEREFVKDCRSLGRFELQNIPPLPAGVVKIAITFNLDEENLLTVTAKEQNIGIRQNIVIKPSCGLTDDQVEQILIDAIHNSKNDYEDRILQETILESKKLIHQIQNAINQAPELHINIHLIKKKKFLNICIDYSINHLMKKK